jgi:hypothetical protein
MFAAKAIFETAPTLIEVRRITVSELTHKKCSVIFFLYSRLFSSLEMQVPVSNKFTVCGDTHGQFYDFGSGFSPMSKQINTFVKK